MDIMKVGFVGFLAKLTKWLDRSKVVLGIQLAALALHCVRNGHHCQSCSR